MLPAVLVTDRLRLPLWTAADVAAIRSGERLAGWHPDFPREDDRDAATLWAADDPWSSRSIVRGVTTLGSIGFFGPPALAADGVLEAEIGYGLVPEARGWGFATEAIQAMVAAAEAEGARVRASVEPTNRASLRALAKCRFTDLRGSDEDGNLVMVRPLPTPEAPGT